ncbi:hypothetical protein [Nostoc sp. MS1]|uniref:hypothetical protein n=1 Tax=Nostoc sp. MS1 TaxID=2764711 RepID=UPI001CC4909A|nr:hypothetical protein [Nostoc sp. MS1]BCL39746.1 hypothetical protein NSMS1_61930 [Nostoc sp. MS1]
MGQGFYIAYVWGILPNEDISHVLDSDEVEDLIYQLDIKRQYESKVRWIGVFVADNDGNLYEKRLPNGRWESISYIINYTAFPAANIEAYLREVASVAFANAEHKWSEFSTEFTRLTHTVLPNPQLLVVHDYD